MTETCPMCDAPLRASDVADDVLVCPTDGPVVYRSRGRDLVVEDVYPAPEEADFPTVGEALRAAAPFLARLIAPRLRGGKDNAA